MRAEEEEESLWETADTMHFIFQTSSLRCISRYFVITNTIHRGDSCYTSTPTQDQTERACDPKQVDPLSLYHCTFHSSALQSPPDMLVL